MPLIIMFLAAFRRPAFSKNAIHLAEPMTVPPCVTGKMSGLHLIEPQEITRARPDIDIQESDIILSEERLMGNEHESF